MAKIKAQHSMIDDLMEMLIYASVVIIPLIFVPQVYSVFTFPKLYVFHIVTLVIVFLWCVRLVLYKEFSVVYHGILWFLAAFELSAFISTLWSVNIWSSLFGVYGRFVGLFMLVNLLLWAYIVFSVLREKKQVITMLWVSVATAALVSIYGIFQGFDLWVNQWEWSLNPLDRVFSTLGHSNHVAAYIGMHFMIAIGLFAALLKDKKGVQRYRWCHCLLSWFCLLLYC